MEVQQRPVILVGAGALGILFGQRLTAAFDGSAHWFFSVGDSVADVVPGCSPIAIDKASGAAYLEAYEAEQAEKAEKEAAASAKADKASK